MNGTVCDAAPRNACSKQSPAAVALAYFLCLFLLAGCASRRVTADHPAAPIEESPSPNTAGGSNGASMGTSTSSPGNPSAAPARSRTPSAPVPEGYLEEGNASWYGVPFNGRRASNGEIYDMHKLTAAHRTLPFDTMVRVTNLNNGKSTVVRITDRGPFVEGRILDLSLAAAREIDSVGAGVVPVRVEVLTPGVDVSGGFFTVQVGAFHDPANAQRLRDRLSASYSPIFIQQYDSPEGLYYRVRVGKVSGEDAARQFGEQLRSREGFTPFVVRLDEQQ
ncbi:MAG TPA: septal ring lytic transglycosylase RlpA family protein [Candidatus Methylomirabilis sp.]|nr:septal ring lytic transglycosylase RlpA family protein [Candidatus Methylomirabilis sp.]